MLNNREKNLIPDALATLEQSAEEQHYQFYQALTRKTNREIKRMVDAANPFEVERYSPDAKRAFHTLLDVARNRGLV